MAALLLAFAAVLSGSPALAQGAPGLEGSFEAAREALSEGAKGSPLQVFGNQPPDSLTLQQIQSLVAALPIYVHEKDGRPADIVNLVFLGAEPRVKELLQATGWAKMPITVAGSIAGIGLDIVELERFHRFPPMSKLYLEGKHQYWNWAQPLSFESRHHFRLWRTAQIDPLGRPVWPGAGIFDVRITWHMTHAPGHYADPHIDRERDYVMASLTQSPLVARLTLVDSPGIPNANLLSLGRLVTDGRVLVVELKP